MRCGICGEYGHNKTSKNCPSRIVFDHMLNMIDFTQTHHYYRASLNHITSLYPKTICLYNFSIRWNGDFNVLLNDMKLAFMLLPTCNFKYAYHNLNVAVIESHANSLVIDTKTGNFKRYEPHGHGGSDWKGLDKALSAIAKHFNVIYTKPLDYCPRYGIQTMAGLDYGLCQTAVLYNLLSQIDSKNYNYDQVTLTREKSRKALLAFILEFLTVFYIKLPEHFKHMFLHWKDLSVFQQQEIADAIIS
jgi:hypothetical protein